MNRRLLVSLTAVLLLPGSFLVPSSAQSGRTSTDTTTQRRGKTPDDKQQPQTQPQTQPQSQPQSQTRSQPQSQGQTRPQETPSTAADDSTIKIDTALVTIPVSVLDRDGKYVPSLTKRDFQLFEDGVEQEIADFGPVEVPFHVVLMLDTSRSTAFKHEDIQRAAITFVEQLRPEDKVMVISFDDKIYIDSEFTSDKSRLRRAIYGTRTGGGTKLYDAVDLVISERLDTLDGRKAIVLFTDGVDTTSKFAKAAGTIAQVEESGVLVYPIRYSTEGQYGRGGNGRGQQGPVIITPWPIPPFPLPRSRRWPFDSPLVPQQWPRGSSSEEYRRGEQYLRDLADRSGARLYHADTLDNLDQSFAQIAEELRHQYALSYYPTNATRDGSYRRIRVRVHRPNLAVRAREGYRATADTAQTPGETRRDRPSLGRDRN